MGQRAHGYYLAALHLEGERALVVGGDDEAGERAALLVRAGARVTIVWPTAAAGVLALARAGAVRWLARGVVADDVRGCRLVVVVARDAALVALVARAARSERAWLSAIDQVAESDLAQVALVRRGDLQIGISSNGVAPAVVRRLREGLDASLDARIEALCVHVAEVRAGLGACSMVERREVMRRLLDGLTIEATIRYPAWFERGERPPGAVDDAGAASATIAEQGT